MKSCFTKCTFETGAASLQLPIEDPRVVYQTSLLRSRLTSLEREIANYRRETEAIRRARKEHDESKQKLEQEQEKFRRYTENEKRRLQLLYSEEQKRVRIEQLKDLPQLKGIKLARTIFKTFIFIFKQLKKKTKRN